MVEGLSEEIMALNLPYLRKEMDTQIQKAQKTPAKMHYIRTVKIQKQRETLKSGTRKATCCVQRHANNIVGRFLSRYVTG